MQSKTIAVMATLDTKGVEAQYVAEQIRRLSHEPLLIDTGVVGLPAAKAAITREEVAQAGGMPLGQLQENRTRERSAPGMAAGTTALVKQLVADGKIHTARALQWRASSLTFPE
jgi:uncharacterized protein (UPF0261 family)